MAAALNYRFEVEVCWLPDVDAEPLFDHLWRERERHPTRLIGKVRVWPPVWAPYHPY